MPVDAVPLLPSVPPTSRQRNASAVRRALTERERERESGEGDGRGGGERVYHSIAVGDRSSQGSGREFGLRHKSFIRQGRRTPTEILAERMRGG